MAKQKAKKAPLTVEEEHAKIQQIIFEREVDEELQSERLRQFWHKFKYLIIGIVVGILLITIAVEWYKAWDAKTRLEQSDKFEEAVISAYIGDNEKALKLFSDLSAQGRGGYKYLSQFEIAGILFADDKAKEALMVLSTLMNNKSAPFEIRSVATLSFVGHQLDVEEPAVLQNALKPLLEKDSAFYGSAVELSSLLLLEEGKMAPAKDLLDQALAKQTLTPLMRQRLSELRSVIER